MLNSIIFSINAVFPLVILMLFGFFIKREKLGLFKNPKDFFNQVDRLVFNIALPVYIFNELSGTNAEKIFDIKLVAYCVSGILLSFFLLLLITSFLIKKKTSRGAFIQGVFRGNFAILGVPLAGNLFGQAGSSMAALIISFAIPLFNILAVVTLEIHADNNDINSDAKSQNSALKIFRGIITNPLIIAVILALPVMFFKISLPAVVQKSVNYIANMSTPLALISLGAGIELQVLRAKAKLSLTASILKTVIAPLFFVIPAVLLGFRDAALVIIFVLFSTPTAVSSYIMAKNMKSDYELAGQIVALTTIICPVTIFIGSLILKSMGLI